MTDIDDLTTFILPTNVPILSTFFGGPVNLQNGDVLTGIIGSGGAEGRFTARAVSETNVPEPVALSLVGLGLAGLAGTKRRRKAA